MEEPLVIQTLKQKRAEISGAIAAYQARIAQARGTISLTSMLRSVYLKAASATARSISAVVQRALQIEPAAARISPFSAPFW